MGLFLSRITALLKPKRRWLQFSVRTLLVGMTVLGVWLGVQTDRARRQARAVRVLEKLSGQLTFDYQLQGPGPWPAEAYDDVRRDIESPGPRWLRRLVGDDYFRTVVACDSWDREAIAYVPDLPHLRYVWAGGLRDEDMAHLAGLSMLQGLNLSCSTNVITDEGLKHLKDLRHLEELWLCPHSTGTGLAHLGEASKLKTIWLGRAATGAGLRQALTLPALRWLSLAGSRGITDDDLQHLPTASHLKDLWMEELDITDRGLGHLRAMPHLKRLWITDVPITDSGLEHLSHVTRLSELGITDARITDAGLKHLARLRELEWLDLRRQFIHGSGLRDLAGLKRLTSLNLEDTLVNDDSLVYLRDIRSLKRLQLDGTMVTDAGLEHLASLSGLRSLDLHRTIVTKEGIRRFQQAMPNTRIYH